MNDNKPTAVDTHVKPYRDALKALVDALCEDNLAAFITAARHYPNEHAYAITPRELDEAIDAANKLLGDSETTE